MIDIHMIQLAGSDPDWRAQAVASIGKDAELHIVPGVHDFYGYRRLRLESMLLGDNPYSTYLDEDDWLEAGALHRMRSVISATKPRYGFVSLERVWDYFSQSTHILRRHHLLVVHKDRVKEMLNLAVLPPRPERALATHPAIVPINAVLYNWRRYPSTAFQYRLEQGEEPAARGRMEVDLNVPLTKFVSREYRGKIDPAI